MVQGECFHRLLFDPAVDIYRGFPMPRQPRKPGFFYDSKAVDSSFRDLQTGGNLINGEDIDPRWH